MKKDGSESGGRLRELTIHPGSDRAGSHAREALPSAMMAWDATVIQLAPPSSGQYFHASEPGLA